MRLYQYSNFADLIGVFMSNLDITIKSSLISQLKSEFASLLTTRVNQYHHTHYSEVEFLNNLITCPIEDCWDKDDIRVPMRAIAHFLENINIKFLSLNTLHISLNSELSPQYHFLSYPTFINDDSCYDEELYITYCNGGVTYDSSESAFDSLLSKFNNEELLSFIKDLQAEISFGTLRAINC